MSREYNLKIGNENYNISLKTIPNGENNSIIIEARNNKSYYYQAIFSLNELMNLSKAFRFCDNIHEAFNTILKIFDSFNKAYLKKGSSEDELLLFLKINLPNGEEQEVKIILNKIDTDQSVTSASNEELLEKIKIGEEENRNLKEEIKKLKNENAKKSRIIESLTNSQSNDSTNRNENIENNDEQVDDSAIVTDLIYSQEELDFIENR
jgi:hypothetical protein